MGVKGLNGTSFSLQYIASVIASPHGLPAALGEPSTSGECASAAAFPDTDEVMACDEPDEAPSLSTPVSMPKETSDFGCQVNTQGTQLMKISVATQTYKSSFDNSVILCDESTQTEETVEGEKVVPVDAVDPPSDTEITETVSPRKDPSFVPS